MAAGVVRGLARAGADVESSYVLKGRIYRDGHSVIGVGSSNCIVYRVTKALSIAGLEEQPIRAYILQSGCSTSVLVSGDGLEHSINGYAQFLDCRSIHGAIKVLYNRPGSTAGLTIGNEYHSGLAADVLSLHQRLSTGQA